jgi:hypothetical protein
LGDAGDGSDDQGCGCFEPGPSGCDNACGSTAVDDDCGVCGGDNGSCSDDCGVPNGDNSSCADCAGVPNGDAENCPGWTVNAPDFEFTATLTVSVTGEDGGLLGDAGDELAALDGSGNVRGIGAQIGGLGPNEGNILWEMSLYSNAAGDAISFQYYDASADEVFDIGESYSFVTNDILGNLVLPFGLNIQTSILQSIELGAGWNWVSVNIIPAPALEPKLANKLVMSGYNAGSGIMLTDTQFQPAPSSID